MSRIPDRDNTWENAGAENKMDEVLNRTIEDGRQERNSFVEHLLSIPEDPPGEPTLTEVVLKGRLRNHDQ